MGRSSCIAGLLASLLIFSFSEGSHSKESFFDTAETYTVRVRTLVEYPFLKGDEGSFLGAGFLINKKLGWIVTNAHVTSRNPSSVEIAFKNEGFLEAELLYIDHLLDFAVLEIPTASIPDRAQEPELGCAADPVVGTPVGAYGHPFSLTFSGTRGIVSGNRHRWDRYWVQTDAAINSGNSGGPLISLENGEVIGINSATYSKRMSEGLGFAVSMVRACRVIELLERGVNPSPPFIPVSFVTDENNEDGLVAAVAYQKQPVAWPLKPGDRLIALADGTSAEFENQADLIHALRGRVGEQELLVEREGEEIAISILVEPRPELMDRIGVHASGIIFSKLELKDDESMNPLGLLRIHSVAGASIGALSRVDPYGHLYSVDGNLVTSAKALCAYLKEAESSGKKVRLLTTSMNWKYRAQTAYNTHQIMVTDVKLVGPRAPAGCS